MGKPNRHRRESGQVAILFAMVFTFMFVLFAFVVDFSHLVNNKINLQIAADAAAYSGAAYQANTLNRLGQMNYRLRQNLKEMAMRVQVTHLRHNKNFPTGPAAYRGPDAQPSTEPFICQQAHGYRSISGLQYANDTNLCRNASPSTGGLPPIVVPALIASFDPFAVAIQSQIRKIAEAADDECRAAAVDNRVLAQYLADIYTRRSQRLAQQMHQIEDWLNSTGTGNAEGNNHPSVRAALESARRNTTLANRTDFKMEVLGPSGGEYIRLNEHVMRASLFFVNFNVEGQGCVGRPSFIDFDGMVSSMNKEQPIITYFAVKLSARPKMLFMPQAWIDANFPLIVAFSAAKPFGSRIGPDTTTDQLVPIPNRPGNNNRMVNFSFRPGDTLGMMNTKLMAYFDALHPANAKGFPDGNQLTGWPDPRRSDNLRLPLQAIRAPTIFDSLMYTIFPDPNRTQDYQEPNYADALFPDFLEQGDTNNQILTTSRPPSTRAYFPTTGIQNGLGWIPANVGNVGIGGPYGAFEYAEEAPSSHSVTSAVGLPEITEANAREFGFATPDLINSGWHPDGKRGRIGYSVKFIGFDALLRTMVVRLNESGQRGPIVNPPTGDPNLKNVFH